MRWLEVLAAFLKLGLTSFGGPVAHLGYFRDEFVVRRRWLGDSAYADLVALCQFLPGPASSQVGIAIGLVARRATPGALAAWLGFTLPSALAMMLFAYGVDALGDIAGAGWLRGFKIVAVAVVAQAVLGHDAHAGARPRARDAWPWSRPIDRAGGSGPPGADRRHRARRRCRRRPDARRQRRAKTRHRCR